MGDVMKKLCVLPLLVLCGCVSQTVEKIQSDPENIQKAISVQKRLNAGMEKTMNERRKDKDYQDCVKKIKTLTVLKNKKSLSYDDMNNILDILQFKKRYVYGGEGVGYQREDYLDLDTPYCEFYNRYWDDSLQQEIKDFCWDKYWVGNWTTAVTLFPLRVTNELVAIGTLGIVPAILGTCSANGEGWNYNYETTEFPAWCWKPGATWNYNTCQKFVAGPQYHGYWKYDSSKDIYKFTEDDISVLTEKMISYCNAEIESINKELHKFDGNMCKDDLVKGCMVDLDGAHIVPSGTRKDGVVISRSLYHINSVFAYDANDYYDGQDFNTGGYYYTYVGNYNDGVQRLPSFRRSKHKVPQQIEKKYDVVKKCSQIYNLKDKK